MWKMAVPTFDRRHIPYTPPSSFTATQLIIESYAIFSKFSRIIVFSSFLPVHRRSQIFHAVVRDDDHDVPYRSLLFPKNSIYSLGSVYRIFQADARRPPSSLIKNQGADTSHHECVVSAPWFSECLISGRCSTETAHILPGYPPADVSKSRPAVPAASRKKLRQCRW